MPSSLDYCHIRSYLCTYPTLPYHNIDPAILHSTLMSEVEINTVHFEQPLLFEMC